MVNRSWKGHAGALLDPISEWQAKRAAAMEAEKVQLETLLNDLKPTGGAYTASMQDVCSTFDIMHAFSSEPTLQETAARLLIVISDTPTLTLLTLRWLSEYAIQQSCYGTMNQAAPDRYPNPTRRASGQDILYARNSHTRLLTLLHDILLAQYQTSVPSQTRTPHRLMMWSCASLLLDIIRAPSRQGL